MDGVLASVYSRSDAFKRKLVDALRNPKETLQTALDDALVRRPQAARQMLSAATDESSANLRSGRGMNEGPANARLAQALADAYNPAGMIVWHGSPHAFTRFDSSKIGTGEGAQAYGHGLYLAESPKVASSYASYLARPDTANLSPAARKAFDRASAEILKKTGNPALITPRYTANYAASKAKGGVAQELAMYADNPPPAAGNLYKVDLPDEDIARMLDWDKPLSQQPESVRRAIKDYADLQGYENYIPKGENAPVLIKRGISGHTKGQDLYRFFGQELNSPEAADTLRAFGVPGIRYLDGGSRVAGQGTSNFVVFPGGESRLTILERNGQALVDALRRKRQ